jgi:SNF2 family DNA or RNA helicase
VISKQAIDEFMNTQLEDWSWVKEIPEEELLPEVKKFFPHYEIPDLKPYKHQLASLILAFANKEFLFFLDMGLGKSRIIIEYLTWLKWKKRLKKVVVLVPNTVVIANWEDEIKLFSSGTLKTIGIYGTEEERRQKLANPDGDMYLLSYSALQQVLSVRDKRTGKLTPHEPKIRAFVKRFNTVVFDEIHNCKNKETLTFRLCNQIAKVCEYRYGLTGTPFGRDVTDLWSQFYLIDRGKTLGTTLGLFRESFFNVTTNYFNIKEYKFRKELEPVLNKRLLNKSIRYSKDEADLGIPPTVSEKITVRLSQEAKVHYQAAVKKLKSSFGNQTEIKNSFIRCRQITSGFFPYEKEDGSRAIHRFAENPKLQALEYLIKSVSDNDKIVIFNEFTFSGDMISEMLDRLEIKHVRLYSGTAERDKLTAKHRFREEDCKVFLANSKSGNAGLNLQIANYVVFFESPVSPIIRKQAEERVPRPGQTKTTFMYDLIVKGSVDERVLSFIREGKNLFEALLENPNTLEDMNDVNS